MRGFPPSEWQARRDLEEKARAIPRPDRVKVYLERMAAEPHAAGSAQSKAVAEYALGLMKEFGLDARIENFEALMPYPTARKLEMTAPRQFTARLNEPALSDDADSADAGQLPTYNAYSASGDITAQVVYVNFGLPEDYEYLKTKGIDVKGKIVLARYGKSWRGTKPKVAAENGAAGCLIYSDPREDGYFQGDVYPKGSYRPADGVQRGSVLDMPMMVGDPLSPGWASEPGSKRLKIEEAKSIMTIPVMPISYADAQPLLAELGGPVAPESWRGALPLTYHVGPGPTTVHFQLDFDWTTKPLHDVIGKIPGSVYPDQWIVYGNHHDAWVNGASDPISGAASLLEAARTLATMYKQGWRPKRTIVFALWDGEEFGLLGSTEWAEKHQEELATKAVLYMNSDSNGRGSLNASGSHALEPFLAEVLRDINDPVSGKPLLDATRRRAGRDGAAPQPTVTSGEYRIGALGAGSDYVAFLDHIGVSSLNLGFGGEGGGGVYHSIYDSVAWYERFADTDFAYGRALAQVTSTVLMRLADAAVLPFEFANLASTVKTYVDEIRKETESRTTGPNRSDRPTMLAELAKIGAQADAIAASAKSLNESLRAALPKLAGASQDQLAKLNESIYRAERGLLTANGLPKRDWYKHTLYAPGMYTGYGVKTLPGVREAVEASRWEEARAEAAKVADALRRVNQQLGEALSQVRQMAR